jgi:hypothetical protein
VIFFGSPPKQQAPKRSITEDDSSTTPSTAAVLNQLVLFCDGGMFKKPQKMFFRIKLAMPKFVTAPTLLLNGTADNAVVLHHSQSDGRHHI